MLPFTRVSFWVHMFDPTFDLVLFALVRFRMEEPGSSLRLQPGERHYLGDLYF